MELLRKKHSKEEPHTVGSLKRQILNSGNLTYFISWSSKQVLNFSLFELEVRIAVWEQSVEQLNKERNLTLYLGGFNEL